MEQLERPRVIIDAQKALLSKFLEPSHSYQNEPRKVGGWRIYFSMMELWSYILKQIAGKLI